MNKDVYQGGELINIVSYTSNKLCKSDNNEQTQTREINE